MSSLFGQNPNSNNSLFGTQQNQQNTGNNLGNILGQQNNNQNNIQNSNQIKVGDNQQNINLQNNSFFGQNLNNNIQQIFPNQQNSIVNPENPKVQFDLNEYKQVLEIISKCLDPSQRENMFNDYLYNPIPKGQQASIYNRYRPWSLESNQQKVINIYDIWEEANEKNKSPKDYFPVQIYSVQNLLERNKLLEIGLLRNLESTINTEKNLENLNKKIEEGMGNKLAELKNCHLKLNELEIKISSKVAQFNHLVGTAQEDVTSLQQIKDSISNTNNIIKNNNMLEICSKIQKISKENIIGENRNYIKDMTKERVNNMLDTLIELQNMMSIIDKNTKINLKKVNGIQKEIDRIMNKNKIDNNDFNMRNNY